MTIREILEKLTFASVDNSISGKIMSKKNWDKDIKQATAQIKTLADEGEIAKKISKSELGIKALMGFEKWQIDMGFYNTTIFDLAHAIKQYVEGL